MISLRKGTFTSARPGVSTEISGNAGSRQAALTATVTGSGDVVEIVLGECPFASAVLVSPDTVCGVHLGLAEGAAEAIGGIEVESLSPRDPRTAHCVLRCRVTSTD